MLSLRAKRCKKGRDFNNALEADAENTAANFCLGMTYLLSTDETEIVKAASFFNEALVHLNQTDEEEDILTSDWAHLGVAVSLLQSMDDAKFQESSQRLRRAIESDIEFPLWILEKALGLAAVYEDSEMALMLADHMIGRFGAKAMKCLLGPKLHGHPRLSQTVFEWLCQSTLRRGEQWPIYGEMLGKDSSKEGLELDVGILGEFERLAEREQDLMKQFESLLKETRDWEHAWETEDVENCRARLLERLGRHNSAATILHKMFWDLHTQANPWKIPDMISLIEKIERWPDAKIDIEAMRRALKTFENQVEIDPSSEELLCAGEQVSILYVGGNETQKQYIDVITKSCREKYPGLEITFELPGWSSNWNVDLERIKPMVKRADCIVLHRFVRTTFGRNLRKYCCSDHPWLPCTGSGRQSLERSIVGAALWHLERN